MDVLDRSYAKKLFNGLSSGYVSNTVTDNADGSKTLTINFVNGDKANITFTPVKGDPGADGQDGISVDSFRIDTISGDRHLIAVLSDTTEKDCGVLPNEQYDDTKIKSDIAKLQTNKVDKVTGKSLVDDTEIARLAKVDNYDDTALKKTIQTVANGLMASAGYSADYKTVEIVTVGGTKKNIPIAPIISHAKVTELSDVDVTDQADGKTLIYNSATGKHEYKTVEGTDEKVKMTSAGDSKYMEDLIDKDTIVNESGTLKAKTLDGLEASIAELNYIKGLQMPVQDLVNAFANGGLKTIDTPFATYADLQSYDVSTLLDDIRYLVRVLADETHDNKITAYLIKKDQTAPTFYGFLSDSRDFTTNPIDLVNEITGKLKAKNIDSDDLFALLTLSDVYKTATTKDEFFGTNGAKALYDELATAISKKANTTDLTTHTDDTDIHITSAERTKWNKVDNKVNKTDIVDNLTSANTDKPLSAKQGKILNDNKVNKTSITTTINGSSTNSQIPGAKTVWDSLYKIIDPQVLVDANKPTAKICEADLTTLNTPSKEGLTNGESSLIISVKNQDFWNGQISITMAEPEVFVRSVRNAGTWTKWRKLCASSVADKRYTGIPESNITNATITDGGALSYSIKNGICYVRLNGLVLSGKGRVTVPTGTFPIPDNSITNGHFPVVTNNNNCYLAVLSSSGGLSISCDTGTGTIYTTISYPVAES